MARAGTCNFAHSTHGPVIKDILWRENMFKERIDHIHHPLNAKMEGLSYKDLTTTHNDFHGRTWHILNHTYSSAAGKSSYFYNVAKPAGNIVRHGLTSASTFDAWRPAPPVDYVGRRARSESPMLKSPLGSVAGTLLRGDPFEEAMREGTNYSATQYRSPAFVGTNHPVFG